MQVENDSHLRPVNKEVSCFTVRTEHESVHNFDELRILSERYTLKNSFCLFISSMVGHSMKAPLVQGCMERPHSFRGSLDRERRYVCQHLAEERLQRIQQGHVHRVQD